MTISSRRCWRGRARFVGIVEGRMFECNARPAYSTLHPSLTACEVAIPVFKRVFFCREAAVDALELSLT
jgi:hypothetical protein